MSIKVEGAISGAEDALGTAQGVLRGVSTTLFRDDVMRIFYSYMSLEFGQHADRMARVMPDKYEHMYEWNMLGFKQGRLWNDVLGGAGNKRFATFTFRPSVRPVPKTTASNTGISSKDMPNLSDRDYFFVNKAMVFENGITTRILPKNHDKLFVPLKHKTRSGWREVEFGGKLSPKDIKRGFTWANSVTQEHSSTAGNFNTLYALFYESQAERVWTERVQMRIDRPIRKVYTANMPNLGGAVKVGRSSRKATQAFNPAAVNTKAGKVSKELRSAIKAELARAELEEEYDE